MLRFVEQALTAGEAFPTAFVFEKTVNAVQTSVFGAAFDDERIPFEKVAVAVKSELLRASKLDAR